MRKVTVAVVLALVALMTLSSCANTIRGAGKDMSNTKNAVKQATY